MNRSTPLWPTAGVAAGALCLALLATPVLGEPRQDEDEDSKTPKVIRIQRNEASQEAQLRGGYLGVLVQDVTRELQIARDLPGTRGALINRVEPNGPAAEFGIRRGDVILEVDGDQVEDSADLMRQMRNLEPGERVKVVVFRDGAEETFRVRLAKRPKEALGVAPPRIPRRSIDRFDRDFEETPEMGGHLDRIRVYREDIQRQLDELQAELTRLRERDLRRLEDEIRALRDEIRGEGGGRIRIREED